MFFSTATLWNLEVDLLFFDTTTTYFEIEDEDDDEGLRRYGHSKDHRLPDRIRAHVLLRWLALLLVRVMEVETGETWDA